MTSGVYPRKPGTWTGNGGKRRGAGRRSYALPPLLSAAEVADIRAMRAKGICYKLIQRKYPTAHRVTLSRAANGRGAYA